MLQLFMEGKAQRRTTLRYSSHQTINLKVLASVHCTDLYMPAAAVRRTFVHAMKGAINLKPFRPGQKLELKPQLHYKVKLEVIPLYYLLFVRCICCRVRNEKNYLGWGRRGVTEKYIEYLRRAPQIHGSTECKARVFTLLLRKLYLGHSQAHKAFRCITYLVEEQ
jgi:hypothetical protein